MTAEVYLDTENVFRGFRPASQTAEADTVQAELFGEPVADGESIIARMRRVVTALFQWFDRALSEPPSLVSSYGKVWDPGVETFLTVLAENDVDTFARVRGEAETYSRWTEEGEASNRRAPAPPRDVALEVKPASALRRALYRWAGVPTIHVHVEAGKNKAEERLVGDFLRAGPARDEAARYLLGSGDHDALYPFDHACIDKTVKVWVLLPPRHFGTYRKFGDFGDYPHIPAGRVTSLPEVLHQMRVHRNESHKGRLAVLERRQARVRSALSISGVVAAIDPGLAHRVALIANIDVSQLHRAVPGSPEWRRALGEEWVVQAAATYLPELMSEGEAALLARGRVHPERIALLVRLSILRRAMTGHDALSLDVIRALLKKLDNPIGAAALVTTLAIRRA